MSRMICRWITMLFVAALSLGGCGDDHDHGAHDAHSGSNDQSDATDASQDSPRTQQSGALSVMYEPLTDPIPLNELFSVRFTVVAEEGASVDMSAVTLAVDAGMPEHGHGMIVKPEVSKSSDGVFMAEGMQFHMPGRWEMTVLVSDGESEEMLRFDVHMSQ